MNMKLKTVMTAAMIAAATMTATLAKADSNPANDSATFTVRITPNVDLGVTVDTTGAAWAGSSNLDVTAALATDTLLTVPVSIAMAGNFNNQELTLTGAALNTWLLDTDEIDVADQMGLYGMFGNNTSPTSPTTGEITGVTNLITPTPTRAGQIQANEGGDTGHVYELANAHSEAQDVDGRSASDTFKLWLRARTPSTTTDGGQMAFTVTVTAVTGAGL
jgi:hypothetical protein